LGSTSVAEHPIGPSLGAIDVPPPDVARRRAFWKKYQDRVDPRRLMFIDETSAKTKMTRRHG